MRAATAANRVALVVTSVTVAALVSACGSPAPAARHAPPTTTTTTAAPTTTTTDPGALPQTDVLPTADTAFTDRMQSLWTAVVGNDPAAATAAFFPETAYLQVKTVADPRADFRDRLVAELAADIAAAHALLGPGAAGAALETVQVPAQYAHWVPPGVCANRVGYYEVPNARLVYRQGGEERSFGIASMISWRGAWYVIHLGAVVRSGSGGVVDAPATGPGIPAPSSTC